MGDNRWGMGGELSEEMRVWFKGLDPETLWKWGNDEGKIESAQNVYIQKRK